MEEIENNNYEQKVELFGLPNEKEDNSPKKNETINSNENIRDEEYNQKINEHKNNNYADYPEKMLELINKIREDPSSYAYIIENSINNIIENQDNNDETKPKIIYKKK